MVQEDDGIGSLEEPVSRSIMDKGKFYQVYKKMLDALDGKGGYPDVYMDFYFSRDPVNTMHLAFAGDVERSDWMDWAVDEGIHDTMEVRRTHVSAFSGRSAHAQQLGMFAPGSTCSVSTVVGSLGGLVEWG